jgi:DNA-binding Xre family transcriptional regulator
MNPFCKTIGGKLQKIRLTRNKSLQTVATALDITSDQLRQLEKDGYRETDTVYLLLAICAYHNITPSDLMQ